MVLQIDNGEDVGRQLELLDEPVVLGRMVGSPLLVRDPEVSRRHARVQRLADGTVRVEDLGSANGTWVEGRRVSSAVLHAGQRLQVGDTVLIVAQDRPTAAAEHGDAAAPATGRVATYSMVGRLLEQQSRRERRTLRSAGLLVAAVLAVAVGVGAVVLQRASGNGNTAVPEVVARLAPSTVLVQTTRGGVSTGTGSGWVLDAGHGLVVTNAHVVNQGSTTTVVAGGRERRAEVVGVAVCEDVALLRVTDHGGLRSAALRTDSRPSQGETVVALGFPSGGARAMSSTTGVVSVARTVFTDPSDDVPAYTDALGTDTALNPGNSGGPLVDLHGRVVGMNAAVRTETADGREVQDQGYAIATERLVTVLGDLRAGRPTGWTGLTFAHPTTSELDERRLPAGLLVTGAVAGTPAASTDLGRLTDALVTVDGRPVGTSVSSLCSATRDLAPGATAELGFAGPGDTARRTVRLKLP